MPRLLIDLSRKIKDVLKHVEDLPVEASSPLAQLVTYTRRYTLSQAIP